MILSFFTISGGDNGADFELFETECTYSSRVPNKNPVRQEIQTLPASRKNGNRNIALEIRWRTSVGCDWLSFHNRTCSCVDLPVVSTPDVTLRFDVPHSRTAAQQIKCVVKALKRLLDMWF